MCYFVDDFKKSGSNFKTVPKKPKGDLKTLLGQKKVPAVRTGQDLHNYLMANLAVVTPLTSVPTVFETDIFGKIREYLLQGYRIVKDQNAETLKVSILYGQWLEIGFHHHTIEFVSGWIEKSWVDIWN